MKNAQPFGKNVRKPRVFCDSHCRQRERERESDRVSEALLLTDRFAKTTCQFDLCLLLIYSSQQR